MLIESDRDEIIYMINKILKASGVMVVIPKDVSEDPNLSDEKFSRLNLLTLN